MATAALENSNRKIDVGSEKHSVLNIWFSGCTQVRKVALDQADPGPLGWTPVCRWSTLMYICNTYFLIYLIMFIFDQKENSSSAPRLHCDAHQAFANLYQVYQTWGPWASPAQQPWPWVTGASPRMCVSLEPSSGIHYPGFYVLKRRKRVQWLHVEGKHCLTLYVGSEVWGEKPQSSEAGGAFRTTEPFLFIPAP